jgi:hypothetical protein
MPLHAYEFWLILRFQNTSTKILRNFLVVWNEQYSNRKFATCRKNSFSECRRAVFYVENKNALKMTKSKALSRGQYLI